MSECGLCGHALTEILDMGEMALAGAFLKPEQFEGAETRDITIQLRAGPTVFKGQPYLLHYAMPNFYFHTTTAYAILRHNGIEIGKPDFIHQLITA